MKIQIKHRFNSSILFEHECENNTIKETLIQGIKTGANLENANLENANLENANLENANLENAYLENAYLENANLENAYLENANLENAYLQNANLENANLENANLRNAYLQNANLENANLRNAYLQNANLQNANLQFAELPIFAKWAFSIKNNQIIKIGCKEKTICEWDLWFASKEEFATKRGTPEFKQIEAVYLAHKAYLTHLNL
jgi:hypothetical protein